jgi:hypothetical protein
MASTYGIPNQQGNCAYPIALLTVFGSPLARVRRHLRKTHRGALRCATVWRGGRPRNTIDEKNDLFKSFSRACEDVRKRLIGFAASRRRLASVVALANPIGPKGILFSCRFSRMEHLCERRCMLLSASRARACVRKTRRGADKIAKGE